MWPNVQWFVKLSCVMKAAWTGRSRQKPLQYFLISTMKSFLFCSDSQGEKAMFSFPAMHSTQPPLSVCADSLITMQYLLTHAIKWVLKFRSLKYIKNICNAYCSVSPIFIQLDDIHCRFLSPLTCCSFDALYLYLTLLWLTNHSKLHQEQCGTTYPKCSPWQ